jgi:sterol desaturase/sphingolipid hydroxylase (fatty acid hydroxylase superfamily)
MAKLCISNKDESVRLFESDLLEVFTHMHWSVPKILYVPITLYLLTRPSEATRPMALLMFLGGVLFWTLTECILHRFVFHYHPSSSWGQRIHFLAHGVHHDYPNDSTRLVMPPAVSVPLAILFYGVFSLLIPASFCKSSSPVSCQVTCAMAPSTTPRIMRR